VEDRAKEWLREECRWVNNLVDRIVPGRPRAHDLLDRDPLLLAAEPFALWAIESSEPKVGFELAHPAVVVAENIAPYYLRKVRILNGAHTALAAHALPMGLKTVGECLEHPEVRGWLEGLLEEEIVPVLEGRVDDPAGFARATLDRFRNPFFEHALSAIALNHEAKLKTRLVPTLEDFRRMFGREPKRIAGILG
jgi:tagaturonate reductase